MVDCRAVTGAPPQELAQSAPNGASPAETHHSQTGSGSAGSGGDAGTHSLSSAASTPPSTSSVVTYSGGAGSSGGMSTAGGTGPAGAGNVPPYAITGPCTPYMCGVKSMMWCAPHSPPPAPLGPLPVGHGPPPMPALAAVSHVPHITPPPPGVNPHVYKSVQASGADLPMNDMATLRFYFNLGVDCMWAVYGPPAPHHPAPHPPPRHYSPRDLSQDMQHMTMHDRSGMNPCNPADQNHKHKPPPQGNNDKSSVNNQGKGNGQRPLLGPRFKRGNQEGNINSNHQNKIHNNMGNKGPNHRRNPHGEGRPYGAGVGGGVGGGYGGGEGECVVEQPLITLPYIPYPPAPGPPLYPIQYYPMEAEPGMIGMMGGMGYVSYEESVEYGAVQHYYGGHPHYPPPPPLPPPLPPHHHHHHQPPHPPPHHHQHHMEPK